MKALFRNIMLWMICIGGSTTLAAQELNATVKVNSDRIEGTHRQLFASLEEGLRTFINGRRWGDEMHAPQQRIDCSFTLVINEALPDGSFRSELYVQSHRKIRHTTHSTSLLIVRDRRVDFRYRAYQPLQFDPHFIRDNLTATIAYYAYLIVGLERDSRTPFGGTPSFRQMEMILSNVQPLGRDGWNRSRGDNNRALIASLFNDAIYNDYRQMWYDYHALGLDREGSDGTLSFKEVASSVALITTLHEEQPTNMLITLFGDAKLEELVTLLADAGETLKKELYDALLRVYPARGTLLRELR